jgi:hypothetical protein
MERLNYHVIDEKFAEIDRWFHEMGLTQHDRIRLHKRKNTELAEAQIWGSDRECEERLLLSVSL